MNEQSSDAAVTHDQGRARQYFGYVPVVLQLAIGVFPLAASGLLAPPWALAVIAAIWMGGLIVVWRQRHVRPAVAFLVPVGTLVVWYGFLTFGERVLGWVG